MFNPEMKIVAFEVADVITTSNTPSCNPDYNLPGGDDL